VGARGGRLHLAIAVGLLSGLVTLAASSVAAASLPRVSCPSCGHNLILNPGAEAGKGADSDTVVKVPDWKRGGHFTAVQYAWSGGDLSPKTPGPKSRGKNYFYGGPNAVRSTGSQTVVLSSAGISAGGVAYVLSGWFGGFSTQTDEAFLTATFETSTGATISTATIGPVTEAQRKGVSKLLYAHVSGTVPAGTLKIGFELVMKRHDGSDNDGLADDLSLVLTDG
jgi:hypothetical protein